MASVEPPAPTYTPNLPKDVIDKGLLSLPQLESVVYAGQSHSQLLPDGRRRGFFIGDNTGVGKGREISGIILDNFRQGRKKAVWVSKSAGLIKDAQRDFSGIGGNESLIFPKPNSPNDLSQSSVQILRDPGWFFKWTGSLVLCAGLVLMFTLRRPDKS